MTDTPDSLFLKAAVARSLLSQDVAKDVFRDCQKQHRPASELLHERGILTPHQIELVAAEVLKAQGPKVIAGFEIRSKLGQGGMGAVYRAVQLSIGREVALKILAPEVASKKGFTERFLGEAKAMGAINHPNVITCFDADKDGDILYMALELMTGGDADQLTKASGGILPPLRACEIVRDGAAGLTAIAKAGLIHRDIKPANIFLGEDGTAKLADLGLARQEDGGDQMTRVGTAMGTPAFMSPEQAKGVEDLDIRSDIYALGATLFALCTGQPPFTGASAYAIVAKVINDPLPDPRSFNPHVPEPVVQLIRSSMHKDRTRRPQHPHDFHQQIERVIGELQKAGLTASTIGALPPELQGHGHPTPHTHLGGAGAVSRHHRTSGPVSRDPKPLYIGGSVVLAAIVIGIAVVMSRPAHESTAAPAPVAPVAAAPAPVIAPPPVVQPKTATPVAPTPPAALHVALNPGDPWPTQAAWVAAVNALAPDGQVAAVAKAVHALNPGFNGNLRTQLNLVTSTVTALELDGVGLTDLRPLSALNGLQELVILGGTPKQRIGLYDLGPLASLRLLRLRVPYSMVDRLEALKDMPLQDLDLGGTAVTDLRQVLKPELAQVAFPYRTVGKDSIEGLRALTLKRLGPTWDALIAPETGWSEYDAGGFPGSRPVIVATLEEPEPAAVTSVAPTEKNPLPGSFRLRAVIIPDGASAKVRDTAKVFNDATRPVLATVTQKRKDATKLVSDAIAKEWKREAQLLGKDDSRLPVFDALKQARQALEAGAGPRDPAFTSDKLAEPIIRACADWRNTIEPLEESAHQVAEEPRTRAISDLQPLTEDVKSGAANVIEQLEAMKPLAVVPVAAIDPIPVAGAIWRIDCMTALPRDQTLRDLVGNHAPAKLTGEIWETSYGKALRGDGKSVQAVTVLRKPLTDRTVMCWVHLASPFQREAGVIGLQAPDGRSETIAFLDDGRVWGVINDNRRNLATEAWGGGTGEWTHLTLTVAGAQRTFYINGVQKGRDQGGAGTFPAGSELILGRRGSGRDAVFFAGLMDGALVFDRALKPDEVTTVQRWQSRQAELIRTSRRAREWLPLPVSNGDFSKINGSRAVDWLGRLDGVSFPAEDGGRFVRLELEKVGQEARTVRQLFKLDPSLREVRVSARIRLPAALDESKTDWQSSFGVQVVFIDPAKQLPELRRHLALPRTLPPGEWVEVQRQQGWSIPAGYQAMALDCTLRGYLGRIDIDDLTLSVLPSRP